MRKYAIEIYILSLVVLATAILVISDWDRVTTLFAGKSDPDIKATALTYFCGEGQLAGPGCAYADASSFIDGNGDRGEDEPFRKTASEPQPEPNVERAPDVSLALSDVGEPVGARDGGTVAMIRGQSRSGDSEMADDSSRAATVIAALPRSIRVGTESDPLAGQPKAASAQPITPSRLASSAETPSVKAAGAVSTTVAKADPPATPSASDTGPSKQTLASLDKGAGVSDPGSIGYVVIGSFGTSQNANKFAAANSHINARTIARLRKGRMMHLVVAGPVPRERLHSLWKEVLAAGHSQAWQLREDNPSGEGLTAKPG
jgi:hypothetical protein